jgi:uncharacterized membrane protein YecN with MAPEG domain
MTTAIICTAILAAVVFLLGFNVSRMRGVTDKTGGSQLPSDPTSPLLIAQRAHGNAAEYVPTLIVLFLLVGARGPAAAAVPLIIGATASRLLHAFAILRSRTLAAKNALRLIGAMGTYLFGVALAVAALFTL